MFHDKLLNTKEMAEYLGCSTSYLRKLQKFGLPYHQLSPDSKKYFNKTEVDKWLQQAGLHQDVVD